LTNAITGATGAKEKKMQCSYEEHIKKCNELKGQFAEIMEGKNCGVIFDVLLALTVIISLDSKLSREDIEKGIDYYYKFYTEKRKNGKK
jgi:prenyltransferase beta subunit